MVRLREQWAALPKKPDGSVQRDEHDFEARVGICSEPISRRELTVFTVTHKVTSKNTLQCNAMQCNAMQWRWGWCHDWCIFNRLYVNLSLQYIHWLHFDVKILIHLLLRHWSWIQGKAMEAEVKVICWVYCLPSNILCRSRWNWCRTLSNQRMDDQV